MNLPSVWKRHFLLFCKFMSDVVETVFRKSEAKHLKLCKSKLGYRKYFHFFWKLLSVEVETIFWEPRQTVKNCSNQNLVLGSFLENSF